MVGRNPNEGGRVSSPLELLFDLTFVIAFSTASAELARALGAGDVRAGLLGFGFAVFAVSWAWINFSWFASAYDTDDWLFRITTMVQMVGVLVLALGLPDLFASISRGEHLDNRVMVLGYVVMRVPMLLQWARVARQDADRAPVAKAMILSLAIAQAGWVGLALSSLSVGPTFALAAVLILVELAGPLRAERIGGGTPWHPHHIAERYGLLVIVTLGEGLLGTMATLSALISPTGPGWSDEVAALGLAGVALTFGLWWTYFVLPWGAALHAHPERSFGWGYGHIVLFGGLVATGAGLHAAAFAIEGSSTLTAVGTTLAVVIPVGLYLGLLYALYAALTRSWDTFHTMLLIPTAAVLGVALLMAATGVSLVWCLAVVSLTPWITVLGYELKRHPQGAEVPGP